MSIEVCQVACWGMLFVAYLALFWLPAWVHDDWTMVLFLHVGMAVAGLFLWGLITVGKCAGYVQ